MQTVVQYGSLSFVYSCFFHLPRLSSSLSSHISPLPFLLLPSISETPSSSLKESCAVVRQPEEAEQVARSGNNLKRHKYKDRRKKIKRTTFKDIGTFLYILILYLGDCVFHTVNIFDFLSKIYHRKKKSQKSDQPLIWEVCSHTVSLYFVSLQQNILLEKFCFLKINQLVSCDRSKVSSLELSKIINSENIFSLHLSNYFDLKRLFYLSSF